MRFDADRCIISLAIYLLGVLKEIQQEYMDYARSHMKSQQAINELTEGEVKMVAGWIAVHVVGGPWVAMDEYGKGSLMDRANPNLEDYINSPYFNKERLAHDLAILGRPKGKYVNIFGKEVVSSGKLEGHDLELAAKEGILPRSFLPRPPSRALRTTAEWMKTGRLQRKLKEAIDRFPFGDFVVVTKDW